MLSRSTLALLFGLVPSLAFAQNYQRIISFGDSLTDNGNLGAAGPPPPYNGHRFTNGFTFAEYLAGKPAFGAPSTMGGFGTTGPGSVNYAFGGARNDNNANSNGPIPSTIAQIADYTAFGGVYGANDVVTYWAGANNLFQATGAPGATQASIQAAALAAGAQTGIQVGGLAAGPNGPKTIVIMNLPNFGSLPAYTAQGPLGIAAGTFASATFDAAQNQAVQAAAAANPGTNFIQVDQASAAAAVLANPAAFGFTNVTAPCVTTVACVTGSTAIQNQFFFWDTVHPTDAGHQLLAKIISDYLYTPTRVADVAVLGDSSFWSRRATTLDMLDKARASHPQGDKIEYFVTIAGAQGQRTYDLLGQASIGGAVTASTSTYSYSTAGLRFGGFKNLGNGWTAGLGLSALTGNLKSNSVTASPTSLSVDVTGTWRQGAMFVGLQGGLGIDRYSDYVRAMSITAFNQSGSTDGVSASTSVEGGYDYAFGNVTLTPDARLGYLYTNVFAFQESSAIASVGFGARTVQGVTGALELRASAKVSEATSVNGMIGYEDFLTKSSQAINGQLINNTAQPFVTSTGALTGAGFTFGVGAQTRINGWIAGVNYRGSVGQKSQTTHQGEVKLSYAW